MAQVAEEDDYADVLGVINALERTCELESKLRQAIASTHPLQTTLDWDFTAADKEREALLAISEQLEYLEDKLREYRNMESRDADNKAVVLSQLDGVRKELVDVTRNCAVHVTFGKDVVREVLAFANVGVEDEQGDTSLQSPARSGSHGAYRMPGGVTGADGLGQQQQQRTYAALMSPQRAAGTSGFSPSTNVTHSVDPSRASSPYSAQQPPMQQQPGRAYYGGTVGAGWRAGRPNADERPAPRPVSAPRRQINLDVATAAAAAAAAAAGGGGRGTLGSARSGAASKQYEKYEAYGYGASAGLLGGGRSEGGGRRILSRLDPPPQRARSPSPASLRPEDIYGAVNGAGSGGPAQPRSAPPVVGRPGGGGGSGRSQGEEFGGMVRIRDLLTRAEQDLTQVQQEKEQRRSPQPPRIFGEDLNSRVKGAHEEGGTPTSASGSQWQLQSPVRPRSSLAGSRLIDAVPARPSASIDGGGGGSYREREQRERGGRPSLSGAAAQGAVGPSGDDALSLSRHRAAVRDAREAEADTPRRAFHARPKIVDPRDRMQGSIGSHATSAGGRGQGGSGAKAVVFLGGLVARLVGLAAVGAVVVLGAQAVGAAASWGRKHLGERGRRPKAPAGRDMPPWMLSSPAPPPGSPQRGGGGGGTNSGKHKRQAPRPSSGRDLPPWVQQGGGGGGKGGARSLPLLPQSPVTHVLPLPEGDLFPSMPAPDVNMAKG